MSNGTSTGPDPQFTLTDAQSWYDLFLKISANLGTPGYVANPTALRTALSHVKIPSTVAGVIGAILGGMAEIAAGCLKGLEAAKEESGGGFQDLISAGLADLFGTQINLSGGGQAGGTGNPRADAAATGAAVFSNFVGMLGGLQEISPDQGAANAKQFLGFGVNFAVVTAFLGIIGGLVPEIHLDELKLIGEEVHHALGLGRLTHTAITPLVRNLIAQPLDLYLKAQLRPDRLPEAQLVRALRSGNMSESDVRLQLAQKGYPDYAIDFLLTDLSVKLALAELILLRNNGDLQDQDVVNNLTLGGMPEDQALLQIKASDLAAVKTQQNALLSELETAYVAGHVDQDTYNKVLSNLSLSDLEEQAFRAKVGFKQEVPRKSLTLGQVQTAVVDAIVDFTYLDTWMLSEGYDDQAQLVLTYETLGKLKTAADKETYKQYKAAVLRKAGKPVPPWLQG